MPRLASAFRGMSMPGRGPTLPLPGAVTERPNYYGASSALRSEFGQHNSVIYVQIEPNTHRWAQHAPLSRAGLGQVEVGWAKVGGTVTPGRPAAATPRSGSFGSRPCLRLIPRGIEVVAWGLP